MKILLLGEYSNVHWTLAEGLRQLGHDVTVASNGDFWKNYRRDISLVRKPGIGGAIRYAADVAMTLPRLRGYDIVQIINPMFLELKAQRLFAIYRYLRKHNRRMVLGAYGMDYYWVKTCCEEKPLRYSDFNFGPQLRDNADAIKERRDWIGTAKEKLNKLIANDCDHIITGLYEYQCCYKPAFPQKTTFIPFPIKAEWRAVNKDNSNGRIRVFIGINRSRSEYKGTDIMLKAAIDTAAAHPREMELVKAESVPFDEYRRMMEGSDAILDQLYSYTPAMNALEAMSKGIVCIGGGEPESYEILGEDKLRPIVNVQPSYDSVRTELEQLVTNPQHLRQMQRESIEYVRKHHDYVKVAKEYESVYRKLLQ